MNTVLFFRLLFLQSTCSLLIMADLHAANFVYTYDSLNRLTNAAYSDGSLESYSYDSAGNRLSRITSAATIKVDVTSPSIPTNLVSLSFTPSQLRIGWDRPTDTGGSGLSGYSVFVNGVRVATTTSTNFLLTGLMPNSQYCLRVAAYDHSENVSTQSTMLCLMTPLFQPPLLTALGVTDGHFQIRIANGTPGPYEVLTSTNLTQWKASTNLVLPVAGNIFTDLASTHFNHLFYQLRWSTNAP